jgi:hypothetical protein
MVKSSPDEIISKEAIWMSENSGFVSIAAVMFDNSIFL